MCSLEASEAAKAAHHALHNNNTIGIIIITINILMIIIYRFPADARYLPGSQIQLCIALMGALQGMSAALIV